MKLADPVVRFITGRRTKWIVLAVWIAIAVVSLPLAGKLSSLQTNDQKSGLPLPSPVAFTL